MAFIPSYKDTEWQVITSPGKDSVQIRVREGEDWKDYWVPNDPANADFAQYQEWLAEGNEPRIIF